MSLCVVCRSPCPDGSALCPHHHWTPDDRWAVGNRIVCDFLHRGIVSAGGCNEHDGIRGPAPAQEPSGLGRPQT
jgi:hypothetical protein